MRRPLVVLLAVLSIALHCALATGGESGTEAATSGPLLLPSGRFATGTRQEQVSQLVDELAPTVGDRRMGGAIDLYYATRYIEVALRAAPHDPRVQRLHGWLLIAQVRYAEAADAFRKALVVNPRDQQAQAGLAEARRLSQVMQSLPLHLRGGRRVVQLAEVLGGATPGVIVLVGRTKRYGPPLVEEVWMATPEVRFYAWEDHGYRETFRTRRVGASGRGRLSEDELAYARFWVGDFQHTGRPQVLLVSGELAGNEKSTYVDIFEVRQATVRPVLHLDGEGPHEWVDLDHNERPEVQALRTVGTMFVGDRGAWYDIYQYDGRRYVRANSHFPAFCREQLDSILDLNKRFPHDWEVLTHIAQAYRDLGQLAEARPYEQQAREAGQQHARQLVDELAPVLRDRRMKSAVDLYIASWQIDDALRAAPEEPRVQRLYGWLLIEQARYVEAVEAFRKVLAANPQDRQAQAGLAEARRLSLLIRSLPLHLKSERRVYRLVEVPEGARPGVAVLLGQPDLSLLGPGGYEAYMGSMELRYFAREKRGYRETFRTFRLNGSESGEPRDALFARLWVGDFQHTGRPQVLLVSGELAGDKEPTYVDIFEVRQGTVRPVLHVDGVAPQEWVDLDHNQRPEVKTLHTIGTGLGTAVRGDWYDIYQYNGRRYVRANGHFPAFCRNQLQEMLDMNGEFPDNPDVLAHIAQAYRDLGQPAEARSYDRQAREAEQGEEE